MTDLAGDVSAIFSDVLAVDATYTPDGGSSVAVRIIPSQPDLQSSFGSTALHLNTNVFQVPVASVENPAEGDLITVDGVTYEIMGEPQRDPRRLIWTIEAKPQ